MDVDAFNLSLEQQFTMRILEESVHTMTREDLLECTIQASRLLMVKDNVIRSLVKNNGFNMFAAS